MLQMYKGAINSPETIITNNISNTDTLIYVQDETKVPTDLPNLMVLGTGISAETIKVLSISGLAITVERAFQGTAKTWNAGTTIARNFTEYDYEALKSNVEELTENQGDLTLLDTVEQSNLVGAINENTAQLAQKVSKAGDTMAGNLNVPTLNNKTPAYAVTPTETIITSGFAAGWSGTVRYSKTQEGLLVIYMVLDKTSDILVAGEYIFTLPVGYRPSQYQRSPCAGWTSTTGERVNGSALEIAVSASGAIGVGSCGSVSTNVRAIAGAIFIAKMY